jgi:hypothetical protein
MNAVFAGAPKLHEPAGTDLEEACNSGASKAIGT